MAVTIRQIALSAGVSRGTVDRVLHERPGVKPQVADHVKKIAEELGYEPNRAGKILAGRKQPLRIGCFFPGIGNAFFDELADGYLSAQAQLADFGVSVCFEQVRGYRPEEHIAAIGRLAEAGCAALCISTVDMEPIRWEVNRIVESGVPVVAVNTDLSHTNRLCYVGCNYQQAGRAAAGLFGMMRNNTPIKLLVITGSQQIRGHNERLRGFYQTLKENDYPCEVLGVVESYDDDERAYQATLDTLEAYPQINSIFIAAAGTGGVCRALEALGKKPGEITVCACDDHPEIRQWLNVGMVQFTISQEPFQQGYQAIHKLFDYFVGDCRTIPCNTITQSLIKIKENVI